MCFGAGSHLLYNTDFTQPKNERKHSLYDSRPEEFKLRIEQVEQRMEGPRFEEPSYLGRGMISCHPLQRSFWNS